MAAKYALMGCGYHGRGVASVIKSKSPDAQIVFVDDNAQPNEKIMGFDVLKEVPHDVTNFAHGSGNNKLRRKFSEERKLETVVAKDASIGYLAKIGEGCFIGAGAFVGSEVVLKDGVIVNTHAIVEHNSEIGAYCNIAPGAIVLGQCIIGENVFVGAGAKIKNNVWICSDVVIGMGAVVLKDITEPGTYVGNPARKLNDNTEEKHVRRFRNS